MSESNTGKTVYYSIDFDNPPALTEEQEARLDRLAEMKDEDIDFSDIPSQAGKTGWVRGGLKERIAQRIAANAERAAREGEGEAPAVAPEMSVRLQADVLSFFRESGDASEERINAVLREYVETHRKSA